jgi:hypothetical protein
MFTITRFPALPCKNPAISLLGAQNFECELIWDHWHKIKSKFSYFSECRLVSPWTVFPQHFHTHDLKDFEPFSPLQKLEVSISQKRKLRLRKVKLLRLT